MHIDPATLGYALDIVLTILSVIFGFGKARNGRLKAIAIAIAAAEHAIDKAAYTDKGALDTAREQFALAVLDRLLPGVDPAVIKLDLEIVLAEIHKHAAETTL